MALTQSSGVSVRAGLVFQAVGLNEHLKIALRDAGVNVVVEITANALSLDKIREANLDVFVVNLDPELEDSLEELTDMLDQMRRPVIFNDGAASSGLAGWDQARWARHLAAKITGELDSTPPRPVDAKSIPTPMKTVPRPVVPVVVAPAMSLGTASPEASVRPAAVVINAGPSQKPSSSPISGNQMPTADVVAQDVFAELDFDFDAESVNKPVSAKLDDEESGLEGFDASAFDMPESTAPHFSGEEVGDLEELFRNSVQPAEKGAEKVESPKVEPPAPAKSTQPEVVAPAQNTPSRPGVKPKTDLSAMNWSLEPLEGEVEPMVPTGRAVFVAKDPSLSPEVVKTADKPTSPALAPVKNEVNESGDFDFFLESDLPEAPPIAAPVISTPTSAAITKQLPAIQAPAAGKIQSAPREVFSTLDPEMSEFDALFADLNDLSPVTMPTSSHVGPNPINLKNSEAAFDSSGLDFDLDFEVGAPNGSTDAEKDDDFADLDSLFSDTPVAPVAAPDKSVTAAKAVSSPAAQTGPARVFVLGASIGGPEAIRSFLSKLKPNLPAAFVLAQHMGAEFLELMTNQLAKASPMPVRLAKPGEAFVTGEIVVVPVNQRFLVDQQSVIQFAPLPTESPYSPSIDQVMTDMADRFGQRCIGIVFSGMASDAIEGAKYLAARGAKVWVQDPATCVISSMIDGAQAAGVVSFVGAPEQLADHVLDELGALN